MSDETLKTLFHPFERELIAAPGKGERWLLSGAQPGFILPDAFVAELICIQRFRPAFLMLERQGAHVLAELPAGETFDGVLILLGRYREDNIRRLRDAALVVRTGGTVVVAGGKTDGVDPLRKKLREAFPDLQHAAKHHGVAFWFDTPAQGIDGLLPRPADPIVREGMTIPSGIFSDDGPDPASVLLANAFDGRLSGAVADFGAGWGYLGAEVLTRCPQVASLASIEADRLALEACRANLGLLAGSRSLTFHWLDLTAENPGTRFDWIVMNPPFHDGRAARPQIGVGFIETANRSLKPGGRLLMVANRNLPYEAALEAKFAKVVKLAEDRGYKLFEAIR